MDIKEDWQTNLQFSVCVAFFTMSTSLIMIFLSAMMWPKSFGWGMVFALIALILIGASIRSISVVKTISHRLKILHELETKTHYPNIAPIIQSQYRLYCGGKQAFIAVSKKNNEYSEIYTKEKVRFGQTKWLLEHYIDKHT